MVGLKPQGLRLVKILLDDGSSITFSRRLVEEEGILSGAELTPLRLGELLQKDPFHRALDVALHYLHYRPRSEEEIRARLRRGPFDPETIERVVGKLKEQGVVDDAAFARLWCEGRQSSRPRSSELIRRELRQKGIAPEMARAVVEGLKDEVSAHQAGLKKARRLAALDYPAFCRKLIPYLRRRGFGYELARRTVNRLWDEREPQTEGSHSIAWEASGEETDE